MMISVRNDESENIAAAATTRGFRKESLRYGRPYFTSLTSAAAFCRR